MIENPTAEVREIAHLLADIRRGAHLLSCGDYRVVYLFFVSRLTAAEIAEACRATPAKINATVRKFLTELHSRSEELRAFTERLSLVHNTCGRDHVRNDRTYMTDLVRETQLSGHEKPERDPAESVIMDLFGTAIGLGEFSGLRKRRKQTLAVAPAQVDSGCRNAGVSNLPLRLVKSRGSARAPSLTGAGSSTDSLSRTPRELPIRVHRPAIRPDGEKHIEIIRLASG